MRIRFAPLLPTTSAVAPRRFVPVQPKTWSSLQTTSGVIASASSPAQNFSQDVVTQGHGRAQEGVGDLLQIVSDPVDKVPLLVVAREAQDASLGAAMSLVGLMFHRQGAIHRLQEIGNLLARAAAMQAASVLHGFEILLGALQHQSRQVVQ